MLGVYWTDGPEPRMAFQEYAEAVERRLIGDKSPAEHIYYITIGTEKRVSSDVPRSEADGKTSASKILTPSMRVD